MSTCRPAPCPADLFVPFRLGLFAVCIQCVRPGQKACLFLVLARAKLAFVRDFVAVKVLLCIKNPSLSKSGTGLRLPERVEDWPPHKIQMADFHLKHLIRAHSGFVESRPRYPTAGYSPPEGSMKHSGIRRDSMCNHLSDAGDGRVSGMLNSEQEPN